MFDIDFSKIDLEENDTTEISLEDMILGMHFEGIEFKPFTLRSNIVFNNGLIVKSETISKLPFELFSNLFASLREGQIKSKEYLEIFGCNTEEDFVFFILSLPSDVISRKFSGQELSERETLQMLDNKALQVKSIDIVCIQDDNKIAYNRSYL